LSQPAARYRKALGWAALAVYGPYALIGPICVRDCSHCLGVWMRLMPAAPGMLPVYVVGRAVGAGWGDGRLEVGLAALVAVLMVLGLGWLSRFGWGVRVAGHVVVALGGAGAARVLAALVRA
jgi:hypothetical protein